MAACRLKTTYNINSKNTCEDAAEKLRGLDGSNMSVLAPAIQFTTGVVGPMLLGTMINFGLYGILCVQIHTYYMTLPNDRTILKIIVYGCFTIETCQTLLIGIDGYDLFVRHLGEISTLDKPRLYWFSSAILGGIVATIGQLLYSYRLWVILRSWIVLISVIILSICASVMQITTGVMVYFSGRISSVFSECFLISMIYFAVNTLCDIEIAGFILSRQHPIVNNRLRYRVKHLIKLIIETGSVIGITHIVCFVLYIFYMNTTYFIVPYMMLSKLYSNTLVLMLNNRVVVPGSRNDMDTDNFGMSLWGPSTVPLSHIQSTTYPEGSRSGLDDIGLTIRRSQEILDLPEVTEAASQRHDRDTC
ncbi:hypothetical protein BDZ94DRAFT_1313719 [Collybia nuda]|uniref:DUF6534 domain-containing protein n=1 Tax=Collybia nuda TaxID=64659 RepID=A0A9P5XUH9_9AGAR|nr:hypothetical protein BDZ94DRAFT_1313719 [Collybia nuda]